MSLNVREARVDEASVIARLKSLVWPDEPVIPAAIGLAISLPTHLTLVATDGDLVVGFVDGFDTLTREGHHRWEVDLLAVHPEWRRQGIATEMLRATLDEGRIRGATQARALVGASNGAMERTMRATGFEIGEREHVLYIGSEAYEAADQGLEPGLPLVPVTTMRYRGLWIEGELTPDLIAAAHVRREAEGRELIGAVVPSADRAANQVALWNGMWPTGLYHWWRRDLRGRG